jgi:hypothetical protein
LIYIINYEIRKQSHKYIKNQRIVFRAYLLC